jgi:hypothetical protein
VTWRGVSSARPGCTTRWRTGHIVAKAAAATYLGRLFPQWGPLADRAVRWRAEHAETFTAADLRAAGHRIDTVVEDAWNRWAE